MTLKEFFRKARYRQWAVRPYSGAVRCADGYCPLGAVIKAGRGISSRMPPATAAADLLDLPLRFVRRIAVAADFPKSKDRRWLLKNLGIPGKQP